MPHMTGHGESFGTSNSDPLDYNRYTFGALSFRVGLTADSERRVLAALAMGDAAELLSARKHMGDDRAKIYTYLARSVSDNEKDFLRGLLTDSRAYEAHFNDLVRSVRDDLHADRLHLQAIENNNIARKAEETARALKRWTAVLVLATVVLAAATVALVVATAHLS
jgi:hypothetical protein